MNYKYAFVVDTDGFYRTLVQLKYETIHNKTGSNKKDIQIPEMKRIVQNYTLPDGWKLIEEPQPIVRSYAGDVGIVRPRWNGTAWIEGAAPEEIAAWELEHPAPPAPAPSIERRISDLEDAYMADKFGGDRFDTRCKNRLQDHSEKA